MYTRAIIAGLLSIVLLSACAEGPRKNVLREEARGSQPRVKLPSTIPPGTYRWTFTVDASTTLKSDGQSGTESNGLLLSATLAVREPAEDGTCRGQWSYDRIRVTTPLATFDTNEAVAVSNDDGQIPPEHLEALKALTRATVELRFDRAGKVTHAAYAGQEPAEREGAITEVALTPEEIRRMLNRQAGLAPGQPVGRGAVWQADFTREPPYVRKADVETQMELISLQLDGAPRTATVHQVSRFDVPPGQTMRMGHTTATLKDMDHELAGELTYDLSAGFLAQADWESTGEARFKVHQARPLEITLVLERSDLIKLERIGPPPVSQGDGPAE